MSADYIGARINLLSNTNIRYEGILKAVDTVESTVVLEQVRVMGTEGRLGGVNESPPTAGIIPVVSFSANDIKDLHVSEEVTGNAPPFPAGGAAAPPGMPQQQQQQQRQYQQQQQQFQQMGQMGMGQQQFMPPSHMNMDQQQMAQYMQFMQAQQQAFFKQQQQYAHAMHQHQMQQQQQQQQPQKNNRQRKAPLETKEPPQSSKKPDATDAVADAGSATPATAAPGEGSYKAAVTGTVDMPADNAQTTREATNDNAQETVDAMAAVGSAKQSDGLLGANPGDKKMASTGAKRGVRTRRKPDYPTGIVTTGSIGKEKEKYTTAFDFDAANKLFDKEDVGAELSAQLSTVTISESADKSALTTEADVEDTTGHGAGADGDEPLNSTESFYSPDSFFDNISCDANEREARKHMTRRETIEKEKTQNLDTFGVTGYEHNNRRPRYNNNNNRNRNGNGNYRGGMNGGGSGSWRQGGYRNQRSGGGWRDQNQTHDQNQNYGGRDHNQNQNQNYGRGGNPWGGNPGHGDHQNGQQSGHQQRNHNGQWRRGGRPQEQFQAATQGVQPIGKGHGLLPHTN